MTVFGPTRLQFSGASTYSGGTVLNGGSIVVAANSSGTASGPLGTGPLTLNSGTVYSDASARSISNPLLLNGNVTFTASAAGGTSSSGSSLAINGPTTVVGNSLLILNDAVTLGGNLSGAGQLTITGIGSLTLNGASSSSFTGNVVLNAGTIGALGHAHRWQQLARLGSGSLNLINGTIQGGAGLRGDSQRPHPIRGLHCLRRQQPD